MILFRIDNNDRSFMHDLLVRYFDFQGLYVDVDPRKDWAPNICTKYQNDFDGEPDDPVRGVDFIFTPCRDVW